MITTQQQCREGTHPRPDYLPQQDEKTNTASYCEALPNPPLPPSSTIYPEEDIAIGTANKLGMFDLRPLRVNASPCGLFPMWSSILAH